MDFGCESGSPARHRIALQQSREFRCSANFLARTISDDLSLIHHHDPRDQVKESGTQGMRDNEDSPADHKVLEYGMNDIFAARIHSGGCFVKDQNGGIPDDCASQCKSLSLPSGKSATPISDLCFVSVRKLFDEFCCLSLAGGIEDLFARRSWISVTNVLMNRVVEQKGLLSHQSDLTAKILCAKFSDVNTVDQY